MRRMGITMKCLTGAALSASLAACGTLSSGDDAASSKQATTVSYQSPYDGTSWELVRWASADGKVRDIPVRVGMNRALTLEFARDDISQAGRVSGFAGCNRYFGSYRYDGLSALSIDELGSTRMACNPEAMVLEADFLHGLASIVSAAPEPVAQPRHLVLVLDDGDVLSFSRRSGNMQETGNKRQIYLDDRKVPCTGVAPQTCYRVRDSKDSPWQLFYGEIAGFDFQPGTSYLLRINEIQVDQPPADAPSVRWVLDGVLEQRSVVE
ncbi:MAG: hypothetical protein KER_02650 [Kerstersia gyiorum]